MEILTLLKFNRTSNETNKNCGWRTSNIAFLTCFFLMRFPVPSAPPQNISGYNVTKHDIRVLWNPVLEDDVNGIITGYRVFFKETYHSNAKTYNLSVPFTEKNVTLNFLRPFTFYSIQVLAFTIKGDGRKSAAIVVRTDEEGENSMGWGTVAAASQPLSCFCSHPGTIN